MLRSMPVARLVRLTLPMSLWLASGCAAPALHFPPVADLSAVTEAKPVPSAAIVSDARAGARYSADVEAWGDRVHGAGGRLCRYFVAMGMKGVSCPAADRGPAQAGGTGAPPSA